MNRTRFFFLIVLIFAFGVTACGQRPTQPTQSENEPAGIPNMANPASVYCEEHGGKLVIRDNPDGQVGICTFPDGSYCDEWAFFRKECQPGQPAPTAPAAIATLEPAAKSTDWKVYQNEQFGYTLEYPANAIVANADDPLRSLYIKGNDGWPDIYIAHPADRTEYRPPEGTDLYQWLTENQLLGEERQADNEIAGTTAVHLRHARSPQSFAFDRYYFIHGAQLYQITIGHVDDKEDWNIYNHFLESFKFTKSS